MREMKEREGREEREGKVYFKKFNLISEKLSSDSSFDHLLLSFPIRFSIRVFQTVAAIIEQEKKIKLWELQTK